MSEDKLKKINQPEEAAERVVAESSDDDGVGEIQVAERVFEHIAYRETREVDGVVGIGTDGNLVDDIRDWVKKGSPTKGVNIRQEPGGLEIDLSISVEYGQDIKKSSTALQERIVKAIETMAGKQPRKVNIHLLSLVDAKPSGMAASSLSPPTKEPAKKPAKEPVKDE